MEKDKANLEAAIKERVFGQPEPKLPEAIQTLIDQFKKSHKPTPLTPVDLSSNPGARHDGAKQFARDMERAGLAKKRPGNQR